MCCPAIQKSETITQGIEMEQIPPAYNPAEAGALGTTIPETPVDHRVGAIVPSTPVLVQGQTRRVVQPPNPAGRRADAPQIAIKQET